MADREAVFKPMPKDNLTVVLLGTQSKGELASLLVQPRIMSEAGLSSDFASFVVLGVGPGHRSNNVPMFHDQTVLEAGPVGALRITMPACGERTRLRLKLWDFARLHP